MAPKRNPENYAHLAGEDAIKKLKELVDHERICMFHTDLRGRRCNVRPMAVQQVSDAGDLWLFSGRSSNTNEDITEDADVVLTVAAPGRSEFLVVHGTASITDDAAKKDELWNRLAKAWFPEGKDDPELTLLKVTPTDCYYWDTTDGRVVSMLKIATAAVTGNMNDSGSIEGKLRV